MGYRTTLAMAGGSVLLSACSVLCDGMCRDVAAPKTDIVIDPIYECQGKNTSGSGTCRVLGASGRMVCEVTVRGEGAQMSVTPFELRVPRLPDPAHPGQDRPVTIVWTAAEPGYRFTVADGPAELKQHPKFRDGGPTDDPDGGHGSAEGRHYRMTFLNGPLSVNGVYYTIAVRKGGVVSRCDPRIINESF